jgi:hypothetical protein
MKMVIVDEDFSVRQTQYNLSISSIIISFNLIIQGMGFV